MLHTTAPFTLRALGRRFETLFHFRVFRALPRLQ
jgi:hypothetical protein